MNPLVRSNAVVSSDLSLWAQIRQDVANQPAASLTRTSSFHETVQEIESIRQNSSLKRGVDSVDEDNYLTDPVSSTPILSDSDDGLLTPVKKKTVHWFDDGQGDPTLEVKLYSKVEQIADFKRQATLSASPSKPTSAKREAKMKLQHYAIRVITEYLEGNYELNSRQGFKRSTNDNYRGTHQIVSLRGLIAKSLDGQDMLEFCELLSIFKNIGELDAGESADLLALFQKIEFVRRSVFGFNLTQTTLANLKSTAGIS